MKKQKGENVFEVIAENIVKLRKRSKLSIVDFCIMSGMHKIEYYNFINLKHKPGIEKLQTIAENNGKKVHQLLKRGMR